MNFVISLPKNNDYSIYRIPKKNKKTRVITAPSDELKEFQSKLKDKLEELPVHNSAHGFIKGRSITTNARPHIKKKFVLSIDLKDFFPSIKRSMVRDLFAFHNIDLKYVDYVLFDNGLAQGSPCSPVISNIYCYKLDLEIAKYAKQRGLSYTRYADDITLSGENYKSGMIKDIKKIIRKYNLKVHPNKIKLMWQNQRQIVTGIIVNEKLNIPLETRKKLRVLDHKSDELSSKDKEVFNGLKGFETSVKKEKNTRTVKRNSTYRI